LGAARPAQAALTAKGVLEGYPVLDGIQVCCVPRFVQLRFPCCRGYAFMGRLWERGGDIDGRLASAAGEKANTR
jgi:hypothetical protein